MSIKKIVSPCISICKTDPVTGFCYGCARNNEEKKLWKDENTSDEWKNKTLSEIISRILQLTRKLSTVRFIKHTSKI